MELNHDQTAARELLASLSSKDFPPDAILPDMLISQDLGIDSLKFIKLILEVEMMAGRKIFDVKTIAGIKTVGDLYGVLKKD